MTGPYAVIAATTLEARRDRANRIRSLLRCGVPSERIAEDLGISRDDVHRLEGFADLMDRIEPPEPVEPKPSGDFSETGRPWWSHPDAETIALCHVIRDEMKAAGA